MNKKRILTLLIEIDENEKPIWIWDSHLAHRPWNGIFVKAICEGNQIRDDDIETSDE